LCNDSRAPTTARQVRRLGPIIERSSRHGPERPGTGNARTNPRLRPNSAPLDQAFPPTLRRERSSVPASKAVHSIAPGPISTASALPAKRASHGRSASKPTARRLLQSPSAASPRRSARTNPCPPRRARPPAHRRPPSNPRAPPTSPPAAPAEVAAAAEPPRRPAAASKKQRKTARSHQRRREPEGTDAVWWREVRTDDGGARGYGERDYGRGGYAREGAFGSSHSERDYGRGGYAREGAFGFFR